MHLQSLCVGIGRKKNPVFEHSSEGGGYLVTDLPGGFLHYSWGLAFSFVFIENDLLFILFFFGIPFSCCLGKNYLSCIQIKCV